MLRRSLALLIMLLALPLGVGAGGCDLSLAERHPSDPAHGRW